MKTITISREYGAGGHTIGEKVAEALGIEMYDKDIIRKTAEATGLDYANVKKNEEVVSRSENIWRRIAPVSYEPKDYLFEAQKKVILDLVAKGPCVIVGRCAEVILKEAGVDSLNVFLYASDEFRSAWVATQLDEKHKDEALRVMHRQDRARRAYYELYTDAVFGERHNYQLMLDSGALGYDKCIQMILDAAKE